MMLERSKIGSQFPLRLRIPKYKLIKIGFMSHIYVTYQSISIKISGFLS